MIYKKVKRIDKEISALGIGCWLFGGDWDSYEEKESIKVIHAAVDAGINLFDVAPVYGWHQAENLLGRSLKNGRREKVVIASKGGITWNDQHEIKFDLSRDNLMREIDESLMRLQTDYIDIYQMHWPDPTTPIEETAQALKEIQAAGKIRHIGLSNFAQKDVQAFMQHVEVDVQQGLYNMLERNAATYHGIPLAYRTEKEMLETVRREGQAFLPYSPLLQGLLTGTFKADETFSEHDVRKDNPKLYGSLYQTYYQGMLQLKEIANEMGKPLNELAINWLRQKQEVTSIIGGVSSVDQLEKNLQAFEWDIPSDAMDKISEVLKPFKDME